MVAASVASSVLGFVLLVMFVPKTGSHGWAEALPAIIAIVLIWAPAFALIPAGILGWLVERPKARRMIARRAGGFAAHIALSVVAAALLWLVFRIVLLLLDSTPQLMDAPSLALFALIGLCSGFSWWFLVVVPERRE